MTLRKGKNPGAAGTARGVKSVGQESSTPSHTAVPGRCQPPPRGKARSFRSEVLLTLPKRRGEELRVEECWLKGSHFLNFRIWYEEGEEMMPSRRGVTVPFKCIPELMEALTGLIDGPGALSAS